MDSDIKTQTSQISTLLKDDNIRIKLKENTKKQLDNLSAHKEMLDQYPK